MYLEPKDGKQTDSIHYITFTWIKGIIQDKKIIILLNLQFSDGKIEHINSFLLTNFQEKCFFCADLWRAKVFSMLIIWIDRWQVLSYLIRVPLLRVLDLCKNFFTLDLSNLFTNNSNFRWREISLIRPNTLCGIQNKWVIGQWFPRGQIVFSTSFSTKVLADFRPCPKKGRRLKPLKTRIWWEVIWFRPLRFRAGGFGKISRSVGCSLHLFSGSFHVGHFFNEFISLNHRRTT